MNLKIFDNKIPPIYTTENVLCIIAKNISEGVRNSLKRPELGVAELKEVVAKYGLSLDKSQLKADVMPSVRMQILMWRSDSQFGQRGMIHELNKNVANNCCLSSLRFISIRLRRKQNGNCIQRI